jgi:sugar/nucleoside kinase (ribokinase family)
VPIIVNSKFPESWADFGADVFVSNHKEWGNGLAGFQARYIVTTQGAAGASILNPHGAGVDQNSYAEEVRDVTGAGDAFLAGVAEFVVSWEMRRTFTLEGRSMMMNFLEAGQRAAAHCVKQYGCGQPGMQE